MQRRRFKNILTFPERLDQEAKRLRAEAEKLPHGSERDVLLRKARQAETAPFTSTTGLALPDYSHRRPYKICSPIRRSKASLGTNVHIRTYRLISRQGFQS
jgi:hypothetical protein